MRNEMSLISNLKIDDHSWKLFRNKYSSLWNESDRLVSIRFKRDHSNQKRIQCAFSYRSFRYLMKEFHTVILKNE